eukprot:GFUD01078774.1.p1 GENE.GFUD01078774.1~~GFUD01078774.1.p1  ORF type:complete len:113 (-),score=21.82 GFUD01078774.1:261-599(-)
MEVFLQVRRQKTTIFLTVNESTTGKELKAMLHGITKTPVEYINLFNAEEKAFGDEKSLADFGLLSSMCKAQNPGELVMAFKEEPKVVTPYSNPPKMPEVMRQENAPQEQVAA